ncbi:hypothetical protein C5F53_06935 [Rhodoferax sp. TS-BS-61-7]|nr:hypothetical protein C5F53_06935 [Rhodoferax sp. TS-BS-61-7]
MTVAQGTVLYRGTWLAPGRKFPDGSWFTPIFDKAVQYVGHTKYGLTPNQLESSIPFIFKTQVRREATFIVLEQSHIAAFERAYHPRAWQHEWLPEDIGKAIAMLPDSEGVVGFYRPVTEEYFFYDPSAEIDLVGKWEGMEALTELARVQPAEFE